MWCLLPEIASRKLARSGCSRFKEVCSLLCTAGFASKQRHTSTHRGVSWHTQTQRWKAQIKVNGKDVNLGRHKEEELAARAYDR